MRLNGFRCNLLLAHSQAMKRVNSLNGLLVAALLFFGTALAFSLPALESRAETEQECLICVGDLDFCERSFFGGNQCVSSGETGCQEQGHCSVFAPPIGEEPVH